MIVFEGVVPGYHRPACLCEDLDEVELSSDEAFEVGELVVHSIVCGGFSGSVVEDLHADDAEDVVDYHEERHEAGGDGDDNDDSAQHLLEVLNDLGLFVHQLVLADDLEEFPEPDDPEELEHGGVDDVAGERSDEEADDDGSAVHRIPLPIEIILQPIADDPDEYIQEKHIRENAIEQAEDLIIDIDAQEGVDDAQYGNKAENTRKDLALEPVVEGKEVVDELAEGDPVGAVGKDWRLQVGVLLQDASQFYKL